jgi:uncharacterized membrane protein
MWHWHGDWNSGEWLSMSIMMVLVWLPLLLLLAYGLRTQFASTSRPSTSAEEDARRAYARGDFDRPRFQQIMEDLRESATQPRSPEK